MYAPTELDVFIKQLKGRMPDIYKNAANRDGEDRTDAYTPSDRKTINNHLEKIAGYVVDGESPEELSRTRLSGTYREKINLLHRLIAKPAVREHYSPRELSIIHALFLKQHKIVSLDKQLGDDGEDDTFTGHDLIGDDKFLKPDEYVIWTSYFKDEFKGEFDGEKLELFLQCLPDHFERFPFDIDSSGNLIMSKYSKKILFETFCSIAGIASADALWKPFLVLIQRVIDKINKDVKI
jgi:hypothetical protein